MIKKLILAGALSLLSLGSAFAACTNPLAIKDATLASISMSMSSGADGFCQYNFNLNQVNATAIATGSGVMTAGTQRTALATDSPGIITLGQTTKSASVPVTWASDQVGSAGTANSTVLSVQGIASMTPILANATNGYPSGAVPITISATGTTGATTATLAASASIKTYICGFSIRANATAAATADSTVTGTVTGTLHFTQWTAPLASGIGLTEERFNPCIPSSAINTGIAVISAAPGSGGVVSVTAWGFQL